MKKEGVLLIMFFLIGVYSCQCPECPECPKIRPAQNHGHYYKVYNGMVKTDGNISSRNNNNFNFIMFNDSIRKYYKNDVNYIKFKNSNVVDVYQYIQGGTTKGINDTILVLKNESLRNNSDNTQKELKARGKFGCIPRFEENQYGKVVFFTDNSNNKFLPLMLAKHNGHDEVIQYLHNYVIRISESNYEFLNLLYKNNKNIEAGINTGILDTLTVFDDINQRSFSFYSEKLKNN